MMRKQEGRQAREVEIGLAATDRSEAIMRGRVCVRCERNFCKTVTLEGPRRRSERNALAVEQRAQGGDTGRNCSALSVLSDFSVPLEVLYQETFLSLFPCWR